VNLHGIASGAVGIVNPMVPVEVRVSTGATTLDDGRRIPTYAAAVAGIGQVQPLSTGDIRQLDSLNIQGIERAIYLSGAVSGLVRAEGKGGDLVRVQGGAFTGSIAGTVLTVESVASGHLAVGDDIAGSGVVSGTKVANFGTGGGGIGTYELDTEQTVASLAMTAGAVWLVTVVLEQWPDWAKIGVVLQD
jgi:hypothetical protein